MCSWIGDNDLSMMTIVNIGRGVNVHLPHCYYHTQKKKSFLAFGEDIFTLDVLIFE